jgi:hypothetical protein
MLGILRLVLAPRGPTAPFTAVIQVGRSAEVRGQSLLLMSFGISR